MSQKQMFKPKFGYVTKRWSPLDSEFVLDIKMTAMLKEMIYCIVTDRDEESITVEPLYVDMPHAYPQKFYMCDYMEKFCPVYPEDLPKKGKH